MKHFQVRLEDGEYAAFVKCAEAAGMSLQVAGHTAIVDFIGDATVDSPPGKLSKEEERILKKLVRILRSEDRVLRRLLSDIAAAAESAQTNPDS